MEFLTHNFFYDAVESSTGGVKISRLNLKKVSCLIYSLHDAFVSSVQCSAGEKKRLLVKKYDVVQVAGRGGTFDSN
jgi:hypothetical protein